MNVANWWSYVILIIAIRFFFLRHSVYSTTKTPNRGVWKTELNQVWSKPDPVNRLARTARSIVHQCNSTQYCSTEIVLLIFPSSRPETNETILNCRPANHSTKHWWINTRIHRFKNIWCTQYSNFFDTT